MEHIEIREMMLEDAEELIACMKKTGGETDNLTFGEEGLPVTIDRSGHIWSRCIVRRDLSLTVHGKKGSW